VGGDFQLRNIGITKSLILLHKLVVFKFCPNLFEISFDRSCATPSVIQRDKFLKKNDVHPVNGKQDSLSSDTQRTRH